MYSYISKMVIFTAFTLEPEKITYINFLFLELLSPNMTFQLHQSNFPNQFPENYITRIRL